MRDDLGKTCRQEPAQPTAGCSGRNPPQRPRHGPPPAEPANAGTVGPQDNPRRGRRAQQPTAQNSALGLQEYEYVVPRHHVRQNCSLTRVQPSTRVGITWSTQVCSLFCHRYGGHQCVAGCCQPLTLCQASIAALSKFELPFTLAGEYYGSKANEKVG